MPEDEVSLEDLPDQHVRKTSPEGFRTVLHSTGFVVRFLASKPPDSGPHCDPNGNQVISDSPPIAGTEGTPAIFGGFPRLSCRAVLTMSAYAYRRPVR